MEFHFIQLKIMISTKDWFTRPLQFLLYLIYNIPEMLPKDITSYVFIFNTTSYIQRYIFFSMRTPNIQRRCL